MGNAACLTVCVCTHNRPDYLATCLRGLARQTVPADQFEILVVDSGSTPERAAALCHHVAAVANARLLRVDEPGLCTARNLGARHAAAEYVAYIDDDAVPEAAWLHNVLHAIQEAHRPGLLSGRILPAWEAPLPPWWPRRLRGVLSIVEAEGRGMFGSSDLPPDLQPCGANLIVHVPTLLTLGGFWSKGRCGRMLLSDDEVQLETRMRQAGVPTWYDSRLVVHHQVQAARLTPGWLLARMYWQGISAVITRRLLGRGNDVWRELPRRIVVALLFLPFWAVPVSAPALIAFRWRAAYATGFIRAALRWRMSGLT